MELADYANRYETLRFTRSEFIRAVKGVKQAHLLVGPTDCIAYVETDSLDALGDTVVALRGVKGVASTDTRIAVPAS